MSIANICSAAASFDLQGQQLCLQNVTVPANTGFLASVDSRVIKGRSAAALGASPFSFGAALRTAGARCTGVLDTNASLRRNA